MYHKLSWSYIVNASTRILLSGKKTYFPSHVFIFRLTTRFSGIMHMTHHLRSRLLQDVSLFWSKMSNCLLRGIKHVTIIYCAFSVLLELLSGFSAYQAFL